MKIWNQPTRLRHIAFCLYAIATCILLGFGGRYILSWPGFSVGDVKIMGEVQHISSSQVERVIKHTIKGNFFTANVGEVREALGAVPWVRHVIVKRRWPAMLEIYFEEHRPIARWSKGGLINTYGEIFTAEYRGMGKLPLWSAPLGSEKELVRRQSILVENLEPLGLKISGLELSARHALVLVVNQGVRVFLGRDNVEERLRRFAWAHRNVLHTRFGQLEYVDLRYNNGFVVKRR